MILGWKKRYSEILKEFNYDEKKDRESAILLDAILEKSDIETKIINLIKGRTVLVIGSGPSLQKAIPKLKEYKKTVKIAADSSIKLLVENEIIPDIVVTDLDGDEMVLEKIAKQKPYLLYMHMVTT